MVTIRHIAFVTAFTLASIISHAADNVKTTTVSRNVTLNVNDNIRVEFVLDSIGRALSKTTFVWKDGGWTPRIRYTVDFGESSNTLSYAAWDDDKRAFCKNKQSLTLNAQNYPSPIVLP